MVASCLQNYALGILSPLFLPTISIHFLDAHDLVFWPVMLLEVDKNVLCS
jgi:hypothetical protein